MRQACPWLRVCPDLVLPGSCSGERDRSAGQRHRVTGRELGLGLHRLRLDSELAEIRAADLRILQDLERANAFVMGLGFLAMTGWRWRARAGPTDDRIRAQFPDSQGEQAIALSG